MAYRYWAGPLQWGVDALGRNSYSPPDEVGSFLDLRSIPKQEAPNHSDGVGFGFFSSLDSIDLGSDYQLLGEGHLSEIQSSASMLDTWESVFGTRPTGSQTLLDCVAYSLGNGSDPSGETGPLPLIPGSWDPPGEVRIDLEDHSVVYRRRINVQSGSSDLAKKIRKVIQDDLVKELNRGDDLGWRKKLATWKEKIGMVWDDPDEDTLLPAVLKKKGKGRNGKSRAEPHETVRNESWPTNSTDVTTGQDHSYTYIENSSGLQVTSGTLSNVSTTLNHHRVRMGSSVSGNDVYCKTILTTVTNSRGSSACALNVRNDGSSTNTYYDLQIYDASGGLWTLYKRVSGTWTNLSSSSIATMVNGDVIEIRANGSSISGTRNSGDTLSSTDTAIPTGSYCAISHYSGSPFFYSDSLEFGDIPTRLLKFLLMNQAVRRASLY